MVEGGEQSVVLKGGKSVRPQAGLGRDRHRNRSGGFPCCYYKCVSKKNRKFYIFSMIIV